MEISMLQKVLKIYNAIECPVLKSFYSSPSIQFLRCAVNFSL